MNKNITFKALSAEHFLLLLKWLRTPHVKKWWDKDINWTLELIQKKYNTYVKGFKHLELKAQVIEKPMHAFIINCDGVDIGYIQYYNKHDFPPEQGYNTLLLPESCAAIDLYIGELDYIGKQIGPQVLDVFLNELVFKTFENAFVDPDTSNIRAICAYEKVGFRKIRESNGITLMIKARTFQL
ncbi:GNAT family N-acetyltransferase [Wolbachia endosymbiont of Ctenocephalides felis wCfeJ]|uniref:GNAT family N-acetyltransferase n=1 Tax=Wolbachia endosymbiont of Ctenocephalides felis wCfeJ TaxID=2732594 RepID=UPI001447F9A8|nr:GNAT family N-acetyltransferase [Wolbachia endosymbiont of Ctenocephalides felis wCfeJ]WCR57620.1 MAG: Aminoglycoside N(6')-acetyltransferase type 1 [Wolbachia endosymbiont of Ctenocephalides felis wCfeJ]